MGNGKSKSKKKNEKAEITPQKPEKEDELEEESGEEEAEGFWTLSIIYEMKNGTTTSPEAVNVNPRTTLDRFKEDIKQLRGIRTEVGIRRDNRNDYLAPDHLTLESLNIKNRACLCITELP